MTVIGVWPALTLFAGLIFGSLADLISPLGSDPDLPWLQSLLLIWLHIVALIAATVVIFIAAYLLFHATRDPRLTTSLGRYSSAQKRQPTDE